MTGNFPQYRPFTPPFSHQRNAQIHSTLDSYAALSRLSIDPAQLHEPHSSNDTREPVYLIIGLPSALVVTMDGYPVGSLEQLHDDQRIRGVKPIHEDLGVRTLPAGYPSGFEIIDPSVQAYAYQLSSEPPLHDAENSPREKLLRSQQRLSIRIPDAPWKVQEDQVCRTIFSPGTLRVTAPWDIQITSSGVMEPRQIYPPVESTERIILSNIQEPSPTPSAAVTPQVEKPDIFADANKGKSVMVAQTLADPTS